MHPIGVSDAVFDINSKKFNRLMRYHNLKNINTLKALGLVPLGTAPCFFITSCIIMSGNSLSHPALSVKLMRV